MDRPTEKYKSRKKESGEYGRLTQSLKHLIKHRNDLTSSTDVILPNRLFPTVQLSLSTAITYQNDVMTSTPFILWT